MGFVFHTNQSPNMLSTRYVVATLLALQLACLSMDQVEGMGLCFGGYPACCSVGEFLRHMMKFDMRGFGMGTPSVFSIINPDPHSQPNKVPFPAAPFPVRNSVRRPKRDTPLFNHNL